MFVLFLTQLKLSRHKNPNTAAVTSMTSRWRHVAVCDLEHWLDSSYLVWFLAVGEGLPHEHAKAPHITFGGKLEVVDAFRRIPLHRPLPMTLCLQEKHSAKNQCQVSLTDSGRATLWQRLSKNMKLELKKKRGQRITKTYQTDSGF